MTFGSCTLTMRHAEPVGFCGRGRGRWFLGTDPGTASPDPSLTAHRHRCGGRDSCLLARAHCTATYTNTHTDTERPQGGVGLTEQGGAARRDHPAGACRSAGAVTRILEGDVSRISA